MKIVVIGSLNMDKVVKVNKIPSPGETVSCKSSKDFFGGKGANQAFAAAKAGLDVMMLGKVGKDGNGQAMKDHLTSVGVDMSFLGSSDLPTGFAFITLDPEAENAITVIEGANGDVDIPYISSVMDQIADGDMVILQEEIPVATIEYIIETLSNRSCKVVLNPAPYKKLPKKIYEMVDYLTPNRSELASIVGDDEAKSMEDVDRQVLTLIDMGAKRVVVTLGKDGVLYYEEGKSELYHAEMIEAIDTTGAGDCFNGYFVAGLAKGLKVSEAIIYAQKAAAICVGSLGAQVDTPTIDEMRK